MIEAIMSASALKYVLTFILGGGLFTGIKTLVDAKSVNQQAKTAKMKTPVEIGAIQVTGMQSLVEKLQEDNDVLREERAYWKEQHDLVRQQLENLSKELARQEQKNRELRGHIEELQAIFETAESRSPAHKAGRDDLADDVTVFPHG